MIKAAILSLSLLTVMSGAAVSPAVADIVAAFPEAPELLGKMVLTTPSLTIIPMSLITGIIISRVSRKKLLYTGIALYIVGGFGGGTAHDINFLLAMRAVLGAGVGILMPLSTGIIADLYSGEEKSRTMGFSSSATNLGAIIATLLAGVLTSFHWRAAFGVYLLGLPVLYLVAVYIPDNVRRTDDGVGSSIKISDFASYSLWGLAIFLVMAAFYTIPVNIALYITQNTLGGAGTAGIVIAVMTASAFVTGLFFGRLNRVLGRFLPALSCITFAASFYVLSAFQSLYGIIPAMILGGFSTGTLVPWIMNGVTAKTGKGAGTSGTAVVSCFLYAGQFFSPVITGKAAALTTGTGIADIYLFLSAASAAAAVAAVMISSFKSIYWRSA
jgi:MFS family permease